MDVNVVCPYGREDGSWFLFLYTLIFVFVYPIGIPVLLWLILKAYRIPQIATRKIVQSGLTVMIQMYMDETCSNSLRCLASVLWNERILRAYFQILCNADEVITVLDLQTSHPKDRHRKLKLLILGVLRELEIKTAEMDLQQFRKFVKDVVKRVGESTKEFKGPDTQMGMLSASQLKSLINHEFKCDRGEQEAPEFDLMETLSEDVPPTKKDVTEVKPDDVLEQLETGSKGDALDETARSSVPPSAKKKKRSNKNDRDKLKAEHRREALDKEGLRQELQSRILMLHKSGVLALPPMAWDGQDEDERRAVQEIGSLFQAYKPTAWKFELYETFRKLLLTAMLVFIYEGKPLQVAVALIINFLVMMYVQRQQPYSTVQLNNMAVFSFIGQLATLFYGLLAMANDGDPDIDPEGLDQVIMRYSVAIVNVGVVLLPFVDMEVIGKIPFSILGGLVCCLSPLCLLLGITKRDGHDEVHDHELVDSDDELADLHSHDPYHAAHDAILRVEIDLLFNKIDTNASGSVTRDELFVGLQASTYSRERIGNIFASVDSDGSLEISRAEFRKYFLSTSKDNRFAENEEYKGADGSEPEIKARVLCQIFVDEQNAMRIGKRKEGNEAPEVAKEAETLRKNSADLSVPLTHAHENFTEEPMPQIPAPFSLDWLIMLGSSASNLLHRGRNELAGGSSGDGSCIEARSPGRRAQTEDVGASANNNGSCQSRLVVNGHSLRSELTFGVHHAGKQEATATQADLVKLLHRKEMETPAPLIGDTSKDVSSTTTSTMVTGVKVQGYTSRQHSFAHSAGLHVQD